MEDFNYSCEYSTLHHNEYGYVVQCRSCDSYQVTFGNIMLNLLPVEYQTFVAFIGAQHKKTCKCDERVSKSIYMPTDSRKVSLVFSAEEIQNLHDILQQAQLMQEVYRALKNSN